MTSLSVPTAAATQQSNWDCIWTGMWGDDDSGGHAGKLPGRLAALGKGRHGSGHGGVPGSARGLPGTAALRMYRRPTGPPFSAVGQLERIWRAGAEGMILDPWNEIRLLTPGKTEVPTFPAYHYFGLVPLDRKLERGHHHRLKIRNQPGGSLPLGVPGHQQRASTRKNLRHRGGCRNRAADTEQLGIEYGTIKTPSA